MFDCHQIDIRSNLSMERKQYVEWRAHGLERIRSKRSGFRSPSVRHKAGVILGSDVLRLPHNKISLHLYKKRTITGAVEAPVEFTSP